MSLNNLLNKRGIIFCNPPIELKKEFGKLSSGGAFRPPLNLLSLAAQTRRYNYETKILDAAVEKLTYAEAAEKVVNHKLKYIGITATTLSIKDASKLAIEIKKRSPESVIIIGGVHVSALPINTIKNHPEFDFGVYGEGEITIIELLEALNKNQELTNIDGLIFRTANKEIVQTKARQLINDLDDLPMPAWDILEGFATLYAPTVSRTTELPSIYINSSRGCPYRCIFCDRSVLGSKYRSFSANRIFEMFTKVKQLYQVKNITIYDENFSINKNHIINLCNLLIINKLNITWSCDMRADFIVRNPDIPVLMYKAGCRNICFGIESGNQRVLDFYKKGESLEEITEAVNIVHDIGITTTGFFIIGGPTETKETIKDTINFLSRLKLDYAVPFYFTPFPGSAIYDDIHKYGKFDEDWEKFNSSEPVFIPAGMNEKELKHYFLGLLLNFI